MPVGRKGVSGLNGPYDAVGIRGARVKRHAEFGFYADDGSIVPESDIAGQLFTSAPSTHMTKSEQHSDCHGPVLFAGLVPEQFGHVILNSLGRLWALEALPAETALLFLPRNRPRFLRYPYLKPILKALNIENAVLLHSEPTRYHCLYTAEDLFGERHVGAMRPKMRDWLARRLPPSGPLTKGRKIYFTRSRLGAQVGRYCNEDLLEDLLLADGYEIIAPESLSLADQIALMQDAEVLLFAESSALHLYALVQREGQRVGLIQRRRELPPLIMGQLHDGPADVHAIDAISAVYWPPVRQDNVSIATLDFERLRDSLLLHRFLSAKAHWRVPSPTEVRASLYDGVLPGTELITDAERAGWLRVQRQKLNK